MPASPAQVMKGQGDKAVKRFALVDVDSCFVACERLFHPELKRRPVVVLSNNDGCVVSRSAEAKALGIQMGAPWFKLEAWATRAGVVARSSNYELYGSLSARLMAMLRRFSATVEEYSIDEAFVTLHGCPEELIEVARDIRYRVGHDIGLPVSVGVGPTRTLAKLASHGAKKSRSSRGVVSMDSYTTRQTSALLDEIPVGEVWGIGRRLDAKLKIMGITTVRQLRDTDPDVMRRKFNINMAHTILELRGISCIDVTGWDSPRSGQVMFSRSFSQPVTSPEEMHQVLSVYAQNVTHRLRKQGSLAGGVWAFTSTSRNYGAFHAINESAVLQTRTDDPLEVLHAAHQLIIPRMIDGRRYARAGICLTEIVPRDGQSALPVFEQERASSVLGGLIDRVNAQCGRESVGLGQAGLIQNPPAWQMKNAMRSARATTRADELVTVYAK